MVMTASTMRDLRTQAPDFHLPDVEGRIVSRDDFRNAPALLVIFMCNHCPFVQHVRDELARIGREYQTKGVAVVGINSNDSKSFPADSVSSMRVVGKAVGYTFPYLHDEIQEVAKAYGAACTPDFFLYDVDRRLVYRGQLDDSRPTNGVPVTGADLRAALDALLEGAPIPEPQKPSIGCDIKWKPGAEPDYVVS